MPPIYDFSFKGESALDVYGVVTMAVGSEVIAERRDDPHVIAGRSGLVHDQDGAVEEIDRRLTIYLPYDQDGANVSPFPAIRAWLKGYGALTLSTLPGRYMRAWITDQIALDPVVDGFNDLKGAVVFRCDPYLYHTANAAESIPQAGFTHNPGTAPALPVITVDAIGDIDLTIGGETILLTDLEGPIIVDSTIQEAYAIDGGTRINMNCHMAGDFPTLPPGTVALGYALGEGALVNAITMTPNWRDEN